MSWRDLPTILGFLAAVVLLTFFAQWAINDARPARDDSDPPDGHSGMTIYTDHLTGCQYLKKGGSSLTPRLDRDGKQICKDTK